MEVRDEWIIADGRGWVRPGDPKADRYDWIEFRPRPVSAAGLHEAGYRFIALTGVWRDEDDNVQKEDLNQWSDHAIFYGPVNIDVQPDGTIRIMPWGKKNEWETDAAPFLSSAMFSPTDFDSAIRLMNAVRKEDGSVWSTV